MKTLPLKNKFLTIFAALTILFNVLPATPVAASSNNISLDEFKSIISTTDSLKLVGLFVNDVMAVRVVNQSSANQVSNNANTVTRFGQADQFGSIGLLAHNYLSGAHFLNLDIGTKIYLVYGDGSSKKYTITDIKQYQALSPDDPHSKFVNLDKPEIVVSSTNVVYEMFGTSDSLVLQTCISKDGNLNWGRLFIIASPVNTD